MRTRTELGQSHFSGAIMPRADFPQVIENQTRKFGSPGKIRTCNPSVNSAIHAATHTNQKLQVPIKPIVSRAAFCSQMEHVGSSPRTELGQFALATAEVWAALGGKGQFAWRLSGE